MKKPRTRSLQWVLVRRLILLQAATLLIFIVLSAAALWIANPRLLIDNEAAVAAIKEAVDRDGNGRLIVHETEGLASFREGFPNVWYIVRDGTARACASVMCLMSTPEFSAICWARPITPPSDFPKMI